MVQCVFRLLEAEIRHRHARNTLLNGKVATEGEVEWHLREVVGELHLLHLCVCIFLVVHVLLEVLLGHEVSAA